MWIKLSLLVFGLSTGLMCGQAKQTAIGQQGTATLHVTTRETVVDVTVTDGKGQPVHGLVAGDFTVKEDGKVQSLRSFTEFGEAPSTEPPRLPPNVFTNRQPPPTSSALNVLLLDFVNTAPVISVTEGIAGPMDLSAALSTQRLVKQEAMKYIAKMPAGTRMAVMGMAFPSRLRILQGFTTDPSLLRAAVDTMDYATDAKATEYRTYCAQQDMRNRMTLEAMGQIAEDLVGTKGRKNLIWFSTGIPLVTNPNSRPECLPDYYSGLTRVYGLLASAEVAVSPVDARGIENRPNAFMSLDGKLYQNIDTLPAQAQMAANMALTERKSEEELSLETVADATGGTAYYNTNDLAGAMGAAVAKGLDYYTLSYVPPSLKYDGKYHKIKVELDRPELKLVYRKGYAAEDPYKQALAKVLTLGTDAPEATNGDMKAPMSRGLPVSTGILLDVQVDPVNEPTKAGESVLGELNEKLKGKPLTRYQFQYVFPSNEIIFAEQEDGTRLAKLEFDIAVYDVQGELVTSLSQIVNRPLTAAQYKQFAGNSFRFGEKIDLPSGQLFVRAGLLDGTANKVGTVEMPVLVRKK